MCSEAAMGEPHVRRGSPGTYTRWQEDRRLRRFVKRHSLNHGSTHSVENQLGDGNVNMTVWLGNLDRLIAKCPFPPEEASFFDLGSGSGIALRYVAERYRHSTVVGIEHDPALVRVAATNNRGVERVEVVRADASNYLLPERRNSVFLFNPFGEATFTKFMELNHGVLARHGSVVLLANDHLLNVSLGFGSLLWRSTSRNISVVVFD